MKLIVTALIESIPNNKDRTKPDYRVQSIGFDPEVKGAFPREDRVFVGQGQEPFPPGEYPMLGSDWVKRRDGKGFEMDVRSIVRRSSQVAVRKVG